MLESRLIVVVVSLLQLVLYCGGTGTCKKTDSCTCTFDDGGVISLKTLAEPGNAPTPAPRFNFTQAPGSNYLYAYSPCKGFSWQESVCQNVAACQMGTLGKEIFNIGKADSATFNDAGTSITYTSTSSGGVDRTTVVNLICDLSATGSVFTPEGEKPPGSKKYILTLKSNCACKNGCIGGGLSPGSILCILFSVLLIIYVISGVLFLKFVRGAEGKELIPNYEFWMDLPLLIKDGILFVAHGCKSDTNNYEQI